MGAALALVMLWAGSPARAEVETPSFPCSAARKSAEVTICVTPELAALDTAMAALYEAVEPTLDRRARARLERDQRLWRSNRDRCDGDSACIARAYAERIDGLMGGIVPNRRRGGGEALRAELEAERRARDEAEEGQRAARQRAERLERQVAELRAALDGLGRRGGGDRRRASREFTRRIDGYCTDFVSRRRVAEVQCVGEMKRRCERGGDCLLTGRFNLPSARPT